MRILILGVGGLIGSKFAQWLLDNTDHEIVGVDNFSTGFSRNLPSPKYKSFKWVEGDIRDVSHMSQVFSVFNPDVCYLFAAYAAEGRSNYIRNFIHDNNTVGASNIINCCVNYDCKLIFTSSVAVYSGTPPFTEETEPNPIDEYGLSKWATEKSIQIAGKEQGLDWCVIRPRNVYGPNQSMLDVARNLFGIWAYNAIKGDPLQVFGDGKNQRSFTYIDDILHPLYNALKFDKQIFNLGSGRVYSIKQASEIFAEVTGYNNIIHTEPRHEVTIAYCDTTKSEQMLGFVDRTSLYEGLKKMWCWAKKQELGERQTPPALEVTKNAHSSVR